MAPSQAASSRRRRLLPPNQVDCIWWKKGYCYRGTKCYFRHDAAQAGVDKTENVPTPQTEPRQTAAVAPETRASPTTPSPPPREPCAICLDTPVTYGLLTHCDHVFCLGCIRDWRSSSKVKPTDLEMDPEALSRTTKTCPLCRIQSPFVIPSSFYPQPSSEGTPGSQDTETLNNPIKDEIVATYLAKLKKLPCRYFGVEVRRWNLITASFEAGELEEINDLSELEFKPQCYFANDCHYAHLHPTTNQPYVFSEAEIKRIKGIRMDEKRRELRIQSNAANVQRRLERRRARPIPSEPGRSHEELQGLYNVTLTRLALPTTEDSDHDSFEYDPDDSFDTESYLSEESSLTYDIMDLDDLESQLSGGVNLADVL